MTEKTSRKSVCRECNSDKCAHLGSAASPDAGQTDQLSSVWGATVL